MKFKLQFGKEIHLLKLENPTLKELKKHINKVFVNLEPDYNLYFKDEDGDEITISSNNDLNVILED